MSSATAATPPASLHVTHVVLSLDVGGLERNVVNQVREGQKLGQRVSIICLDRPGTLAPQVEAMGAKLVCLERKGGLRPSMIARARRVLADLRPDVVHTHQLVTLLYAGLAARSLRVPVILHTEHGREKYTTRRRTRLLGRIAGLCCHRFYCLTSEMAGRVADSRIVPQRKISIIQNGIDVSGFDSAVHDGAATRQALGIPAVVPLIGTVGRLNEVKRQDVLLRAFADVRAKYPTAHLLLVGDGPLLAELRSLAENLGIAGCVHFAGYQLHSGPFLKAMDIFALTSRSEGMPQAVLEASVMGLPVVASRVGGLPEVIDEGVSGVLFEVGNHVALANCLCAFLANPEKARSMGTAARQKVTARFSVARMAAEYHQAALELMGKMKPAGAVNLKAEPSPSARLALEKGP